MRRPLLLIALLGLAMLFAGWLVRGSGDEPPVAQTQARQDEARGRAEGRGRAGKFAGANARGVRGGPAVQTPPANDRFADSRSIGGSDVSVGGTNRYATWQAGEPGSSGTTHSVWYSWTAPFSGPVTTNTCESGFDTVLVVYVGPSVGGSSQVASDDDACGSPNGSGSRVAFDAVGGATYRIAVRGFGGSEGEFTLGLVLTDLAAPRVYATSPADDVTGVVRESNVTATFSEKMNEATIDGTTFELSKAGSTNEVGATVAYNAAAQKAVLDPNYTLRPGIRYKAAITTGATDLAGNPLDQNQSAVGDPQKAWFFRTQNRRAGRPPTSTRRARLPPDQRNRDGSV